MSSRIGEAAAFVTSRLQRTLHIILASSSELLVSNYALHDGLPLCAEFIVKDFIWRVDMLVLVEELKMPLKISRRL